MSDTERVFPRGRQILLAYASQSGTAQGIAEEMAQCDPQTCDLVGLADLTPQVMAGYGRQLFVVATHGEGAPPENAVDFFRALRADLPDLREVEFALLALGSRAYPQFCQFGRDLFDILVRAGAEPRVLPMEVHNSNAATIAHWRRKVEETFALKADPNADWETATVMAVEVLDAQTCAVTLYVQSLEWERASYLAVREASARQAVNLFEIIPDHDSPFTTLRVTKTTRTARGLSVSQPGDKWLVQLR